MIMDLIRAGVTNNLAMRRYLRSQGRTKDPLYQECKKSLAVWLKSRRLLKEERYAEMSQLLYPRKL